MTSALAPHPTPVIGAEVTVGPPVRRSGTVVHVVRDTRSEGYFQVSPKEAFVLARLDGERTFGQVAQEYGERFGRALDDTSWQQLLTLLYGRRLLVRPDEDHQATQAAYQQLRAENRAARTAAATLWRVRVPLLDPGPALARLQQLAPWLRHPWTAAVACALVLLMLGTVAVRLPSVWGMYVDAWTQAPLAVAAAVLVMLASLAVHELAHAMTCGWFGGRCREMGVSWRFPLVTVYTKVEDIYLVPHRWQRVVVSLSGVLAGLVALLPVFLLWLLLPAGHPLVEVCVVALVLGSMVQLVNLAPMLGLDGQKALSHAIGVWDISAESRTFWVGLLRTRSIPSATGAARWLVPVYGVVVAVLLTVVTLWTLWVGWAMLTTGEVPW